MSSKTLCTLFSRFAGINKCRQRNFMISSHLLRWTMFSNTSQSLGTHCHQMFWHPWFIGWVLCFTSFVLVPRIYYITFCVKIFFTLFQSIMALLHKKMLYLTVPYSLIFLASARDCYWQGPCSLCISRGHSGGRCQPSVWSRGHAGWNQGKVLGFEAEAREAHCYCQSQAWWPFLSSGDYYTFIFVQNKFEWDDSNDMFVFI
jgi:hypothetical protein